MTTTVAERIAQAREAKGITAYALSKLCQLSTSHVSMIERGLRPKLEIETVIRIARALESTTDWILTGAGEPPAYMREPKAVEEAGAA